MKINGSPLGFISPLACIGEPPEHRAYRWLELQGEFQPIRPVIDSTAIIEAFATVDAGISAPTTIGARTMVMKHAHVGHDASIGSDCNIAPGAIIGGHCYIEDNVRVGIGAMIRPRTTILSGATIGAGAVVVSDIPRGETWAGNPARKITNKVSPQTWTPEQEYDAWIEWYEAWH